MVKKIRFPLELADGTRARSLDELKEHFDLESVLGHYKSGKLLKWLQDRYIEAEANAVAALDENAPDFQQELCAVFGVEFSGSEVDLEEITRRQERLAKLRQFTDEAEFIQNIDFVAFDQEELDGLLKEGCEKIYLCGEKFTVPASVRDKSYIGVNSPSVEVSEDMSGWDQRSISFTGCEVENLPVTTQPGTTDAVAVLNSNDDEIPASIADDIYHSIYDHHWSCFSSFLETPQYFLFLGLPSHPEGHENDILYQKAKDLDGLFTVSKKDGTVTLLLRKTDFPKKSAVNISKWIYDKDTIFALFCDDGYPQEPYIYAIDMISKEIKSLGVKIDSYDPFTICDKYCVCYTRSGSYDYVTCIDSEKRKKYVSKHRLSCYRAPFAYTKDATYFITNYLDDKKNAVAELIEFSLSDKIERVVTKMPFSYYNPKDISFYNNKIFLLIDTISIGEGYDGYNLGYVDLASDAPQYQCIDQNVCIWKDSPTTSSIYKYDSGWFFVSANPNFPIKKFDFEAMKFTTVAEGCGYSKHCSSGLSGCGRGYWSHTVNRIIKVGQWLYFRQGEKGDTMRVSLNRPMQVEPLREKVVGQDL